METERFLHEENPKLYEKLKEIAKKELSLEYKEMDFSCYNCQDGEEIAKKLEKLIKEKYPKMYKEIVAIDQDVFAAILLDLD